ncbi:MAG: hypothetical protein ACR2LT_09110 [Pyrinomonadaceae bacterium]
MEEKLDRLIELMQTQNYLLERLLEPKATEIKNLTRFDAPKLSADEERAARERWKKRAAGYSPFMSFHQFLAQEKKGI